MNLRRIFLPWLEAKRLEESLRKVITKSDFEWKAHEVTKGLFHKAVIDNKSAGEQVNQFRATAYRFRAALMGVQVIVQKPYRTPEAQKMAEEILRKVEAALES